MGISGAGVSSIPVGVDASGNLTYTDTSGTIIVISGGTDNAGTVGVGITAAEYGDTHNHVTVLTVAGVLPDIAGTAAEGEGLLIYTFPAGVILVDWVHMSVGITQTDGFINADTPEIGIGSVIATGAVAVLNTPGTFEDYITGTAAANCTGTATVVSTESTAGGGNRLLTGDAHTMHINVADTWAVSGDAAATLAGSVTVAWRFLGA